LEIHKHQQIPYRDEFLERKYENPIVSEKQKYDQQPNHDELGEREYQKHIYPEQPKVEPSAHKGESRERNKNYVEHTQSHSPTNENSRERTYRTFIYSENKSNQPEHNYKNPSLLENSKYHGPMHEESREKKYESPKWSDNMKYEPHSVLQDSREKKYDRQFFPDDKKYQQVFSSSTFYEQLLYTKVFFTAFIELQFGFVIFWQNNISPKAARKMLAKYWF